MTAEYVWLPIVLSYIAMTGFYGWLSTIIKVETLKGLKTLFFLLFLINTFLLSLFPLVMSLNIADPSQIQPLSIIIFTINGFLLFFSIWMYSLHLIRDVFNQNKEV
jgi:hypothetical protein